MRFPMRLLAFLLIPVFLLGIGVRTSTAMAAVAQGLEAAFGEASAASPVFLHTHIDHLENRSLSVLGLDAAEVVEEEGREGEDDEAHAVHWNGSVVLAIAAQYPHPGLVEQLGRRAHGQSLADAWPLSAGLQVLHSVFRI